MTAMSVREELVKALTAAKKRAVKAKPRVEDHEVGTGTNERGPRVETNAPANSWPTDGDAHG